MAGQVRREFDDFDEKTLTRCGDVVAAEFLEEEGGSQWLQNY